MTLDTPMFLLCLHYLMRLSANFQVLSELVFGVFSSLYFGVTRHFMLRMQCELNISSHSVKLKMSGIFERIGERFQQKFQCHCGTFLTTLSLPQAVRGALISGSREVRRWFLRCFM